MRIVPPLSAKRETELVGGELIRLEAGKDAWRIAVRVPAEANCLVLIFLEQGALHYRRASGDMLAVSYGHDYFFRPDCDARILSGHSTEFEKSGAMLIGPERPSLRISPPTLSLPTLYYDIAAGTAGVDNNASTHMAILDWSLVSSHAKDTDPPIFIFRAS